MSKQATLTVSGHAIEFKPYKASSNGFTITIPHQVQVLVDGVFVGYCPTTRQPVPVVGQIPAEIAEAVAKAASQYWGDDGEDAVVKQTPVLGSEGDNE